MHWDSEKVALTAEQTAAAMVAKRVALTAVLKAVKMVGNLVA